MVQRNREVSELRLVVGIVTNEDFHARPQLWWRLTPQIRRALDTRPWRGSRVLHLRRIRIRARKARRLNLLCYAINIISIARHATQKIENYPIELRRFIHIHGMTCICNINLLSTLNILFHKICNLSTSFNIIFSSNN